MSVPTIFTALSSLPADQFAETVPEGNPTIVGFISEEGFARNSDDVSKNGRNVIVSIVTEYTDNCAPCNNICEPPPPPENPTTSPIPE